MEINKKPIWEEAIKVARNFSDHYSILEVEQELIYKYVSTLPVGSIIMELGTCNGKTSALLAYLAKHNGYEAYGIDDFSLEWNPISFNEKMKELDLPFHLVVGKTGEVPWKKEIDFLIIDAGHDPENIKRDTEKWIPFVKTGGYVAFHDYEDPYNSDSAHWGIRYYADLFTNGWEDVGYVERLKIRRRLQVLKDFSFDLKKG